MCEVVERFKKEGYEQGEKHGYERGDKHGYERAKQEYKHENMELQRKNQEMKNKFAGVAENLRKKGMNEDEIRDVLGEDYDKNIS